MSPNCFEQNVDFSEISLDINVWTENWNEVVNEGNPAVYLRLKSSVGSYLQHQPAPRVTLHSLLFPEIRIKSKMMIKTILMIMKMTLMISSISEMISFGGGVIPGGPRDPVGEHLYLPFTPAPSSSSSSSPPSSSSSSSSSSSPTLPSYDGGGTKVYFWVGCISDEEDYIFPTLLAPLPL